MFYKFQFGLIGAISLVLIILFIVILASSDYNNIARSTYGVMFLTFVLIIYLSYKIVSCSFGAVAAKLFKAAPRLTERLQKSFNTGLTQITNARGERTSDQDLTDMVALQKQAETQKKFEELNA